VDRLDRLEVQVRDLVTSQIVEAEEFVVRDDRGQFRASWRSRSPPPCLTFYDRAGQERLKIGLRSNWSISGGGPCGELG
jgi:hypothetical protein